MPSDRSPVHTRFSRPKCLHGVGAHTCPSGWRVYADVVNPPVVDGAGRTEVGLIAGGGGTQAPSHASKV